ncbi:MAG: hypothetical protein KGJ90_07260 [Patescibacteria group bacterium]|nr:hypothetical protein [Patescibacteria group bacterium]
MADDETTETGETETTSAPKPRRRRRTQARVTPARVEKRAGKVGETIHELVSWQRGRPDSDEHGFLDTLDRDSDKVGYALAQVGERFKPVGAAMDFLLGDGGPLSILVALSSTLRAARRSLQAKAEQRQARRAAEAEAEAEAGPQYEEQVTPFPDQFDPATAEIAYREH